MSATPFHLAASTLRNLLYGRAPSLRLSLSSASSRRPALMLAISFAATLRLLPRAIQSTSHSTSSMTESNLASGSCSVVSTLSLCPFDFCHVRPATTSPLYRYKLSPLRCRRVPFRSLACLWRYLVGLKQMMNGGELFLPPGFRFHPTDEELVVHYLCRRCATMPIPVPVIAEVDLYKYDPWHLPGMALYGEKEWYFFSPRDRKYPNGSRPNRAAGSGYWKATGADKPIGGSPRPVAIKKALVFYSGKPPKGEKTNWIMHEYRLADVDRSARNKNTTLRLDDWVLCRIYHKKGALGKQSNPDRKAKNNRPAVNKAAAAAAALASSPKTEMICFDSAEPRRRLLGDSSSSERALSSPELGGEWEVESEQRWGQDWEEWDMDLGLSLVDPEDAGEFPPPSPAFFCDSFQQDLFPYLENPF